MQCQKFNLKFSNNNLNINSRRSPPEKYRSSRRHSSRSPPPRKYSSPAGKRSRSPRRRSYSRGSESRDYKLVDELVYSKFKAVVMFTIFNIRE